MTPFMITTFTLFLIFTTTYAHEITTDVPLEQVPGYELLQGKPANSNVTIYYTTAHMQGPFVNNTPIMDYYALVYSLDNTTDTHPFGPTLRVKQGGTISIKVIDDLAADTFLDQPEYPSVPQQMENITDGNGFTATASLNLHMHGIYGSPGLLAQPTVTEGLPKDPERNATVILGTDAYTGGDNIYIRILPRVNSAAPIEPKSYVTYVNDIARDHMPGMHWIHGHYEGMLAYSVNTANSIFIVEDDQSFLPAANGCANMWKYLETVPEVIMHITTTSFSIPRGLIGTPYENYTMSTLLALTANTTDVFNAFADFPNQQYLDTASEPSTRLCCNTTDTLYPFKADQNDFALVNGAYMPRIRLPKGAWRRWRILNASIQDMYEISVVLANDTSKPAPCEFLLYAKDGVYMMQIPRKVPALYLNPAARSEIFLQCNGTVGSTYVLASGYGPAFDGLAGCDPKTDGPNCNYFKSLLATIEITAAEPQLLPIMKEDECTPLRSDYVADMRDPALKAVGAEKKLVKKGFSMTDLDAFGCNINNKWFEFPAKNPFTFTLGTITELSVQYANHHAFHIHVQPFQLVNLNKTKLEKKSSFTPYFQEGDFQDTLYVPMVAQGANVTVRLNPGGARFAGYGAAHCHLLPHEDEGCMIVTKLACPGLEAVNEQPETCLNVTSAVKGTYVVPPLPTPSIAPAPGGISPNSGPSIAPVAPSPVAPSKGDVASTVCAALVAAVFFGLAI